MKILKNYFPVIVVIFLSGLVSCSSHTVGGRHAGGNITQNYHDGHLGSYHHYNP